MCMYSVCSLLNNVNTTIAVNQGIRVITNMCCPHKRVNLPIVGKNWKNVI